ncbi:hypothetical protein HK405_012342 [Cladochytrium tenue]|nr:hypothetical protein HK405_012342 [Cladochytrium tenue]
MLPPPLPRQAPLQYAQEQPPSSFRLPIGAAGDAASSFGAGQSLNAHYSQPRLMTHAAQAGPNDCRPNDRDSIGVAAAGNGGMPFGQHPALLAAAAAAATAASGLKSPHENGLAVQKALLGFPGADPAAAVSVAASGRLAVVPSSLPIAPDPRAPLPPALQPPRLDYAPPVPSFASPPPPLMHPAAQQPQPRQQFPGSQMDAHRAFDPEARAQQFSHARQPQLPPSLLQGQQHDYTRRSRPALRNPPPVQAPAAPPALHPQLSSAGPATTAAAAQDLPRLSHK